MASKKTTKTSTASRRKSQPEEARTSLGEEGRTGRRVPIQLLVDYKADGHYLFDFCKDLGTGGVFIQTAAPLPMGSSIDLTFTIPDSKETLVAKGTVIWVQAPVAERKELTPGMGVQFQGFSGEQRKMLEEFVVRYHGQRMTNPPTSKRAV
jgi:type IV pilus assembly protein PilZ